MYFNICKTKSEAKFITNHLTFLSEYNSYLIDQLPLQVGNWSRWLTDSFSVDSKAANADDHTRTSEVKWFHLLNSLSHLLMVPKDMIVDRSVRTEVSYISQLYLICNKIDLILKTNMQYLL